MAKLHWLLWQPEGAAEPWQWCRTGPDGKLDVSVQTGSLATAANMIGDEPTYLLVRSENVVLTREEIIASSLKQAKQILPFKMEERLLSNPGELHYCCKKTAKKNQFIVGVVEKQWLAEIVDSVVATGIRLLGVYPDVLSIPVNKRSAGVSILHDKARWLVRQDRDLGYALGAAFEEVVNKRLLPSEAEVGGFQLYRVDDQAQNNNLTDFQTIDSPLALFATGFDSKATIELAQGAFNLHKRSAFRYSFHLIFLLILLMFSLSLVHTIADINQLTKALSRNNNQITAFQQRYFQSVGVPPGFDQLKIAIDNKIKEIEKNSRATPVIDYVWVLSESIPDSAQVREISLSRSEVRLLIAGASAAMAALIESKFAQLGIRAHAIISQPGVNPAVVVVDIQVENQDVQ